MPPGPGVTTTVDHAVALVKPGAFQPGCSSRASYVSPSYTCKHVCESGMLNVTAATQHMAYRVHHDWARSDAPRCIRRHQTCVGSVQDLHAEHSLVGSDRLPISRLECGVVAPPIS